MIFGEVALDKAEGMILAHTQRLGQQILKKGTRLTADDIALLHHAGIRKVTGARLEAGDLGEDEAAGAVAEALAGRHLALSEAKTGRCNLIARHHGVLQIDARAIDAANAIDEAITIATRPEFSAVAPGETAATIKIIPLAVPGTAVQRVIEALPGNGAMSVAPIGRKRVGLVLTRVPGGRERLLDKAASVLRDRLDALGLALAGESRCAHETDQIAVALSAMDQRGMEVIVVCGAAATVDRGDVVPAGIEQAGGRIDHFGMPAEPGNLLVLGALGGKPVIGMPGCARSPRLNGFDWVLERSLAGIDVKAHDLQAMGVGGLITEQTKGRVRSDMQMTAENAGQIVTAPPRVAAVVLAAGSSRRMGKANKLLLPYRGAPMVLHAVRAATGSNASPVIAVTGHEADALRAALAGFNVQFAHSAAHSEGMSQSLKAGLAALPPEIDGALILLGDMPLVSVETINDLIEAFDPWADASICIPAVNGKRGNPILLARHYFSEIMALEGDTGARAILADHSDQIVEVPVEDDGILRDFDTAEDLAQ